MLSTTHCVILMKVLKSLFETELDRYLDPERRYDPRLLPERLLHMLHE